MLKGKMLTGKDEGHGRVLVTHKIKMVVEGEGGGIKLIQGVVGHDHRVIAGVGEGVVCDRACRNTRSQQH